MNDLTRYEEYLSKQLNNLPVANEDFDWVEMKKMLDEDDDKGGIIPPPLYPYDALWGSLVLLLFIGGLWWFVSTDKKNKEKEVLNKKGMIVSDNHIKTIANKLEKQKTTRFISSNAKTDVNNQLQNTKNISAKGNPENNKGLADENKVKNNLAVDNTKNEIASLSPLESKEVTKHALLHSNGNTNLTSHLLKNNRQRGKRSVPNKQDIINTSKEESPLNVNGESGQGDQLNSLQELKLTDDDKFVSSLQITPDTTFKKDTIISNALIKKGTDSSVAIGKKKASSRKFYIAVGLAAQQSINTSCNCDGYSNDNSKVTPLFTDYLPSVYVRLYHRNKWFIQSEFKYAAPQYIDESMYKAILQIKPLDYITTSYLLKKIYYNQGSMGFNYFIFPNWSAGMGVIYNRLSGVYIQEDVQKKLYGIAYDSLISSRIIKSQNDSNAVSIVKNDIQVLFETQYKWKYFSLGARYAFGLQPYIKYTDPFLGSPVQKKNNSLNVFIRYELWRSGKRNNSQQ